MQTLREAIQEAEERKVAIGHFNISNIETFWGIVAAAREIDVPVIIGLSEGEGRFFGLLQAKTLVESVREEFGVPLFLNADHSYSYDRFKEAVDARFDAAIYDGAKLSMKENISETKKCVQYARSVDPEILVEGELGYIGTSSNLFEALPEGVSPENMTKPEEAEAYVKETGVDLFAPSVGNIHGMLKNAPNPRLDIARIQDIRRVAGVPLVLHGGSGISDGDFRSAIDAGIAIIHINTEIRVAWKEGMRKSFEELPNEVAPYKLAEGAYEGVKRVVAERLALFSNQ